MVDEKDPVKTMVASNLKPSIRKIKRHVEVGEVASQEKPDRAFENF
jgi:hypothetical protein